MKSKTYRVKAYANDTTNLTIYLTRSFYYKKTFKNEVKSKRNSYIF